MTKSTVKQSTTAAAQLVRNLIEHGDFGHATTTVEIVETHISWVLLTGEYAYKIKKPVDLGFLNFSTLALRHKYCLLELELNRRFAPDLYLDVVAIGGRPERPVIDATPALEWAVRMQQFPADARLDRQIEQGYVSCDDMHDFGETLAGLHDRSPALQARDARDPVNVLAGLIEDNFTVLRTHCTESEMGERLSRLAAWCAQELTRLAATIRARQEAGRVRECHGDLHLENLILLNDRITPFDCIEFDAALRTIDVSNEVAFLLMDTLRIERQDLGFSFLNRYLEVSGDYRGTAMLPFYCVYRCLVRAKITVLRQVQFNDAGSKGADNTDLTRYIDLAERLVHPTHQPCLIICRGLSGSGKTHLSSQLLSALPAIRIRSDIVRKQLHDIGELESSESGLGEGLYDAQITAQTYATLAQYSAVALTAGYDVIVDATCLRHADRAALRSVANHCAARVALLDCTADDQVLIERINSRHKTGRDASEANLRVLDWQRANLESLSADEQRQTLTVDTGQNQEIGEIARQLRKIATAE